MPLRSSRAWTINVTVCGSSLPTVLGPFHLQRGHLYPRLLLVRARVLGRDVTADDDAGVHAGAAVDEVGAVATIEVVITVVAGQRVVAVVAASGVIAGAAGQLVVARTAAQRIVPECTGQ